MTNNGKEYESFVAKMQQALLNAENITTHKNIKVEVNKKIVDNCGIKRQFDIYWEYELAGLTYKTVIECKDYDSSISVEKIDALIGKIQDIPDLKAVFATKKGYQSGAKLKAEQNKIDLLIVREQNDSDWSAPDGTPLIKKVCINMRVEMPAHIDNFSISLDEKWTRENTDIDTSQPFSSRGLYEDVLIDDIGRGEKYTLRELQHKLTPTNQKTSGKFEKIEKFENAFIHHQGLKLKLLGYKIEYSIKEPIEKPIEIDFSKELDGVIEYMQKGIKKSIFKNGVVKQM